MSDHSLNRQQKGKTMDSYLELATKAKQTSNLLCDDLQTLLRKSGPVEEMVVREIHSAVHHTHNCLVQLLQAVQAARKGTRPIFRS